MGIDWDEIGMGLGWKRLTFHKLGLLALMIACFIARWSWRVFVSRGRGLVEGSEVSFWFLSRDVGMR